MRRVLLAFIVASGMCSGASPASANHGSHQIITSGPALFTNSTTATFEISWDVYGRTCQLDGAPASCANATTVFANLSVGSHTFTVQGVADGPPGCIPGDPMFPCTPFPVSDSWSWRIDQKKPTVTLKAPKEPFQLSTMATATWSSADTGGSGVGLIKVKGKVAPYNGDFTASGDFTFDPGVPSVSQSMQPGETRCFSVKAIDKAGNASAYSPWRCTALPLDDSVLMQSIGWTHPTGPEYFNGTASKATTAGEKMTAINVANVARVGVVATVCPTCGSVEVKVGGTTIGTISLVAPEKKDQRMRMLPPFALRSAAVKILTTSGKTVKIDGLALSRK